MARFGLLILNKGRWDQTPILTDTAYYRQMLTPSQNLNQAYGYLWWLNGQPSFDGAGTTDGLPGAAYPERPSGYGLCPWQECADSECCSQ